MLLTTLATGSDANAYIVNDGTTRIMVECGLPVGELRKRWGASLADLYACLVTHEHKDHAKSAQYLGSIGVLVYATAQTAIALDLKSFHPVSLNGERRAFNINTLRVMPFPVHHDAAEPCGFFIESKETQERLVFMTDTYNCVYRFEGVTEIAVECNYDEERLEANDRLPDSVKERIRRTHMSLDRCLAWLDMQNLSVCKHIHLLHISPFNAGSQRFCETVQAATGIKTTVG